MQGIQEPSVLSLQLLCESKIIPPKEVYLKNTIVGNCTNREENKRAREKEDTGAILDKVVWEGLSKEVTLKRN